MLEQIEKLLNDEIRPALASHGGGIEIVELKENKLYVRLQGGCKGCQGARATIKGGVEKFVRAHFPEIEELVDVTEHGYC